ncbi:MAG: hypothetical protein JWQ73_635 [Variovorax sp.]|nr:hypothetical protein [Variovorax sp.]
MSATPDSKLHGAVPTMISMVVPTRNRAHTLRRVADSYFAQEGVDEIVFVSDAGDDDTETALREIASKYPGVRLVFMTNASRQGASQSRNIGVQACTNAFILFCDDDEYLEAGYAQICLDKLLSYGAGAVSGRRIYMRSGETQAQALDRFGSGLRASRPFIPLLCEFVNGARFTGDIQQPITNAIILTRTEDLRTYGFDPAYARGNGYREESDYQMNLYVNGKDIWVTNRCHSFHLPLHEVRTGGQRTSVWKRLYWENHYTRYFYKKYYDRYASRMGMATPRVLAVLAFGAFSLYKELVRPPLYRVAVALMARRKRA